MAQLLRSCFKFKPSSSTYWHHIRRYNTLGTFKVESDSISISSLSVSFPFIWLRDSCQGETSVHPSTRQKLHRSSDIRLDIAPVENGVKIADDSLHVSWNDGHESVYPAEFLKAHHALAIGDSEVYHHDVSPLTWDYRVLSRRARSHLFVTYDSLQDPAGLLTAIDQISKFGLLFVRDVPYQETSNETCELNKLAQMFGHVRETFYGRFWDVKNVKNSRNIAYTDLDLGLHMDLLYFQNPPQYQFLHCLRNQVKGGMSYFVDSVNAAYTLKSLAPDMYKELVQQLVPFHYINDGHHLHYDHPTIELGGSDSTALLERPIKCVNYSPPFQAPLSLHTKPLFFEALAKFMQILNDPANKYSHTLAEGDAVVFDNRRVLHARTAFYDIPGAAGEADGVNRWLKGCYIEGDAMWDRGRVLRASLSDG